MKYDLCILRKSNQKLNRLFYIGVLLLFVILLIIIFTAISNSGAPTLEKIGIGGGGAFYNPMIDPSDSINIYVTSDMGALYYSYNQGKSWSRTEARGVFTQTHITSNMGNILSAIG